MHAKAADFVAYSVSDLDDAVGFYRDELGLAVETHLEDMGWAEFALPPTTLALRESDDEGAVGGGGAAVAMAVDDVEAAVADLRETDATILQEAFDTGVCDMATIADPDGNELHLHRRHDGTAGRVDDFPEGVAE
jgi:predicted enzyme related to lactoylglutathione lyase